MDAVEFIKEYRRMCNKYIYSDACGDGVVDYKIK